MDDTEAYPEVDKLPDLFRDNVSETEPEPAHLSTPVFEECTWCERAREIFFGASAVLIGLVFFVIGVDLASGGSLSAYFSRERQ